MAGNGICTPGISDGAALDTGTNFGENVNARTSTEETARDTLHENSQRVNREASIDELANHQGGDTPPIDPVRKTDEIHATGTAKAFARWFRELPEAQAEKAQLFNDMYNTALRANKQQQTWWTNFQNTLSNGFINDKHDLAYWADLNVHTEGRATNNPLVQELSNLMPKIRGILGSYHERMVAFNNELTPLARKTGLKKDIIGKAIGTYLIARHAIERNAFLLARWREQLRRAEKVHEVNALEKQIDDLEANLNVAEPDHPVKSSGFTNAQAEIVMQREAERLGLSREEMDVWAKRLSSEYDFLLGEQARNGTISAAQLAAIRRAGFEFYAPMFSREHNLLGAGNDASHLVPTSKRATEGTYYTPDDAYNALAIHQHRVATEIGSRDLATMIAAIDTAWDKQGAGKTGSNGLVAKNYAELVRKADHDATSRNILNLGGIVADRPYTDKKGNTTIKRMYFYFDPTYHEGVLTGMGLNRALSSTYKMGSKFLEGVATATSYYGQSFTRFQPFFAPIGALRDFMERSFHMVNREYMTEDGRLISGGSLVGKYARNSTSALTTLTELITGRGEPDGRMAQFFDEYIHQGGYQKYTPGTRSDMRPITELYGNNNELRTFAKDYGINVDKMFDHKAMKVYNRLIMEGGEAGQKALRVLDMWNDIIQNAPAFAHFVTLREAGVSARSAGAHVTEIMNMSQRGTITNALAVVAPFVRPTMQGAQAFARTMGLSGRNAKEIVQQGWKGWATGLGAAIAYGLFMPMERESMGYDEKTGRSRYDGMPISRLTNFMTIGNGDGSYFKLPLGFGPVRVARALALTMDRIWRGQMDPADGAFEVLFSAARDIVPGNAPQFDFKDNPTAFLLQFAAPAALRPLAEAATNTNYFGAPVTSVYDQNKAAALQGRKSTAPIWHNIARYMLKEYGFDVAPEMYHHMAQGLALGPVKLLANAVVNFADNNAVRRGWNRPTALEDMGVWLSTLGGTLFYGKERTPAMRFYMDAKNEIESQAKRLGISLTQEGKPGEEGEAVLLSKLLDGGLDQATAEDYVLIRRLEKEVASAGRAFNEKHKEFYNEEDSIELRDDFTTLFDQQENAYVQFVNESNYYRNK